MADRAKKISELPVATSAVNNDIFIIVANTAGVATTKQITVNNFKTALSEIVVPHANASTYGTVKVDGSRFSLNATGYLVAGHANSTVPGTVYQGNNVYINDSGYIGVLGANSTVRGVVRISNNFSVDANATLSLAANVNLGNVTISDATFTGNVYLGIVESNASQLIHFGGTIHSHFIPHTPNNYTLGNTANMWQAAYVDGVLIGNNDIRATNNGRVNIFGSEFAQLQWSDVANTSAYDGSGNTSWIYTESGLGAIEVIRGGAVKASVSVNTSSVQLSVNSVPLTFKGTAGVPANSTATGVAGDIAFDSDYIYYCVANNTWKRAALSTW